MNVYQWKAGSIHKIPAEVAAAEMNKLAKEDRLNAKELVEISRPEDAPLHCEFEWDDSIAAEKYREVQGQAMIRHLTVKIAVNEHEYPTKYFFKVRNEVNTFEPITVILKDEDKTAMLLEQARRELQTFKAKYAGLKELASVIKAINDFNEDNCI